MMTPQPNEYWAPSSPGDLADRWTQLNLALLKAGTEAERRAAVCQLRRLRLPDFDDALVAIVDALGNVNERLWDLEADMRRLLTGPDTPDRRARLLEASRRLPLLKDTRAHLKARIDDLAAAVPTV